MCGDYAMMAGALPWLLGTSEPLVTHQGPTLLQQGQYFSQRMAPLSIASTCSLGRWICV